MHFNDIDEYLLYNSLEFNFEHKTRLTKLNVISVNLYHMSNIVK